MIIRIEIGDFYNSYQIFINNSKVAIENIIIIQVFTVIQPDVSYFILRLRILLLFFPYWTKIIHLEKVMDFITCKRHYFGGIILIVLVLLLFFSNLSLLILISIFIISSFVPFIVLTLFFKNKEMSIRNSMKIFFGVLLIGMGSITTYDILILYIESPLSNGFILDFMNVILPILFIIGTLLIFESFYKK